MGRSNHYLNGAAPAQRFQLPDGTTFGIIPSTTTPFCATCDRSRVTADGMWYRCLYATTGTDLRKFLRAGAVDEEMRSLIRAGWEGRRDRGAEERKALERDGLRVGGSSVLRSCAKIPILKCMLEAADVLLCCPCSSAGLISVDASCWILNS